MYWRWKRRSVLTQPLRPVALSRLEDAGGWSALEPRSLRTALFTRGQGWVAGVSITITHAVVIASLLSWTSLRDPTLPFALDGSEPVAGSPRPLCRPYTVCWCGLHPGFSTHPPTHSQFIYPKTFRRALFYLGFVFPICGFLLLLVFLFPTPLQAPQDPLSYTSLP